MGGWRVGGAVSLKRGQALALIGALGIRGLTTVQLLDGACPRSFAFYIARVLGLRRRYGYVLVLDNLPVHKLGGLQQVLA
ncbi:hypothetical protein H8B15_20210 [Hymenobacter sp. BT507]|uniref:Tc1-like transposase DDE domain-containing protein n=1 Tax=Hymenobacter citatus TaxID=2763506 RepID=A0ABR7MRR5_9BACT|nr:hypothetical protein [Hymenobacter citatus]MBC6613257.1 hypothetical protein [Hymenobacter citatus]